MFCNFYTSVATANEASCILKIIYLPHIGLCVIALILAALAITTIVYGQCNAGLVGKGRQRSMWVDDPYLSWTVSNMFRCSWN